ncbi:hypothetical protein LEP1GSC071_0479 [Leptospira santarosai str. JET]|nr:hypothetical protein LEP1GSC071_0479 [Leptospira santarosai str. JET]
MVLLWKRGIRIASFSEEINVYFREFKAFLYSVSQNRDRFLLIPIKNGTRDIGIK